MSNRDKSKITNPVFATTTHYNAEKERIVFNNMADCQYNTTHCQTPLVPKTNPNTIYPYKLARLVHYDYSTTKKWYIDYSAYNINTGKLQRKRISEFNNIANLEEKIRYVTQYVTLINEQLIKGYHIDDNRLMLIRSLQEASSGRPMLKADESIKYALSLKKTTLRYKSYLDYNSCVNRFLIFLDDIGKLNKPLQEFTKYDGRKYRDYIHSSLQLTPVTVNKNIAVLKSLFEILLKNDELEINEMAKVERLKETYTTNNKAISNSDIQLIKNWCLVNDPDLWLVCSMIFYTYCRPNEIRNIKISHINIVDKTLFIPGAISKSHKEKYPVISDQLLLQLKPYLKPIGKLDRYLFTQDISGPGQPVGVNNFGNRFRECRKQLKLDQSIKLYHFKHSGNIAAARSGANIYSLMSQNGHADISTTMIYLKSLGLSIDNEFRNTMNNIEM